MKGIFARGICVFEVMIRGHPAQRSARATWPSGTVQIGDGAKVADIPIWILRSIHVILVVIGEQATHDALAHDALAVSSLCHAQDLVSTLFFMHRRGTSLDSEEATSSKPSAAYMLRSRSARSRRSGCVAISK